MAKISTGVVGGSDPMVLCMGTGPLLHKYRAVQVQKGSKHHQCGLRWNRERARLGRRHEHGSGRRSSLRSAEILCSTPRLSVLLICGRRPLTLNCELPTRSPRTSCSSTKAVFGTACQDLSNLDSEQLYRYRPSAST